ncbi:MAG: hypothetical protein J6A21_03025 [Lentisphaeria bacterium]|nr:hypothetical protein [Lentisphaeria bacterium]
MSTEEMLSPQATAENVNLSAGDEPMPGNPSADVTEEETTSWDDVPDPVDEGEAPPTEETPPEEKENPPAEPPADSTEPQQGTPAEEDPFSFLDDLDKEDDQIPETEETPPETNENPPQPAPEEAPKSGSLDYLDIKSLIEDLPDGDVKEFAKGYPEEAAMAAALALQILKKAGFDAMKEEVKRSSDAAEAYGKRQQALESDRRQRAFESEVLKLHADAGEIVAGKHRDQFAAWLKRQPKFLQRSFRYSSDPEEAADIIGRFKRDLGMQTTANRKRMAQIAGTRSVSGSRMRPSSSDTVSWNDVPDDEVPEY